MGPAQAPLTLMLPLIECICFTGGSQCSSEGAGSAQGLPEGRGTLQHTELSITQAREW